MTLHEKMANLADRVQLLSKEVRTEEAAKTAFVLPFLQALGYDIFNPLEVVPEHVADHGVKKGEKVDYAIRIQGTPVILMECKQVGAPLAYKHASQLFRYFTVTEAKFGVLTDGVRYLFYTDLDSENKMDEQPFLEFNLSAFDEGTLAELSRFCKSSFSVENIQKSALGLKTRKLLLCELKKEFQAPSAELVQLLFSRVNSGCRFTSKARESFEPVVKQTMDLLISELFNSKLQAAMIPSPPALLEASSDGVVTTEKECTAFKLIQDFCAPYTDPEEIVIRDAKSYCSVLYQDNNRKPLARLYFNRETNLQVGLFSDTGEDKFGLASVEDLVEHKDLIVAKLRAYQGKIDAGSGFNVSDPVAQCATPCVAAEQPESPKESIVRFRPTVFGG